MDPSVIKWLRECYREDHTRSGIRDFFSASVENRLMVKTEDRLGCRFLDDDVLAPSHAEKLEANLSIHIREKELLYGCLFFCGEIGTKVYRAPLILYPSSIESRNGASLVKWPQKTEPMNC